MSDRHQMLNMSLHPFFEGRHNRPSTLFGQHFGVGLTSEDFPESFSHPRMVFEGPDWYMRSWRRESPSSDVGSTVRFDKDKFQANLDVQQFKPEEITVKLTGENIVTVEGNHEERQDQHGYVSRHFIRRYVLPDKCDVSQLQSKLSSDGVLTITAPTVDQEIEFKEIPIQQTGQPAKRVQENKTENIEP